MALKPQLRYQIWVKGDVMSSKFSYLLIALTLVLGVARAEAFMKEGVYLGLGCGAVLDRYDFQAKNVSTGLTIDKQTNQVGCLGTIFFGYGFTNDSCLYLGGEVGTNYPRRTAKIHRQGVALTSFTFTNEVSVQDYLTFDLLPGFRFDEEWLIYGRLGISYANVSLKLEENPAAGVAEYAFYQDRYGFRAGLGISHAFNDFFAIGLDYYYSWYEKIDTFIELYTTSQKQRPQSHYVGVSLIVTFPRDGW